MKVTGNTCMPVYLLLLMGLAHIKIIFGSSEYDPDNLEGLIFKQRNYPFPTEAKQQNDLRFSHLMSRLPKTDHVTEKIKRRINLPTVNEEYRNAKELVPDYNIQDPLLNPMLNPQLEQSKIEQLYPLIEWIRTQMESE